ncbi:hypothetical protein LZ32DRAFT_301613 [Colletotrichum eremochloae]|nr:hypothetical protein LZ32DRAFT_301613 [Colletotrichum eremochloae]
MLGRLCFVLQAQPHRKAASGMPSSNGSSIASATSTWQRAVPGSAPTRMVGGLCITLLPEMFSRRKSPCGSTTLPCRLAEARRKTKPIRVLRMCLIRTTIHPCLSHPIAHQPCCTSSPKVWGQGRQCPFQEMIQLGRMKMTLSTRFPLAVLYVPWPALVSQHPSPPSPSTHHLRCPVQ